MPPIRASAPCQRMARALLLNPNSKRTNHNFEFEFFSSNFGVRFSFSLVCHYQQEQFHSSPNTSTSQNAWMTRKDSLHRHRPSCASLRPQWRGLPQLLVVLLVWIVGTTVDAELRFETTHKMGVLLTIQFMTRFRDITNGTTGKGEPGVIIPSSVTVPSVIVVRDLFDATVSGYLYHKSGRECWLNLNGGPPRKSGEYMAKRNWTEQVSTVPVPKDIRWPKNICRTLEHTTETMGMGIYLEFARNSYYRTAVQLKNRTQDPTLFVCFEELMNQPDEIEARVRSFYHSHNTTSESAHRRLDVSWNDFYSGGHATNHDPELRTRLRQIAMELDCVYFGCETKKWSDSLNCTSERTTTKPKIEEETSSKPVETIETSNFTTSISPWKPYLIQLVQWLVVVGIFWLHKRTRQRINL